MLKTAANPGGLPIEVFDQLRAASIADRSQLYKDLAGGQAGTTPGSRASVLCRPAHTAGDCRPRSGLMGVAREMATLYVETETTISDC